MRVLQSSQPIFTNHARSVIVATPSKRRFEDSTLLYRKKWTVLPLITFLKIHVNCTDYTKVHFIKFGPNRPGAHNVLEE